MLCVKRFNQEQKLAILESTKKIRLVAVAPKEMAALAKRLIEATYKKQGVKKGEIILHADRGSPMIAKTTAQLCATLGINKSHSRPYVSNDNPYSESQFKTLKYFPGFPERFGSLQDSVSFCRPFFRWYNNSTLSH